MSHLFGPLFIAAVSLSMAAAVVTGSPYPLLAWFLGLAVFVVVTQAGRPS